MSLLKRLSDLISSTGSNSDQNAHWIAVKCGRCGEIIRTRVDLRNDLSIDYGDRSSEAGYFCRKTLMGESHCFQRIEVMLRFDKNRQLLDRSISGGDFADEG